MVSSIIGLDSETYNGYPKVLCASNGTYIESSNTVELLDFLMKLPFADYYVFYNINYDLGSIIKEYIVDNGSEIHDQFYEKINAKKIVEDEEEEGYSFEIGKYKLKYLSGKMFSVQCGKNTRRFWDASNFYKTGMGHMKLDDAAQKFLNDSKNNEELEINRKRLGEEQGYYDAHREKIIEYCIKDADLTRRLFMRSIQAFETLGLRFPALPYSEASIFKEYISTFWDDELKANKYYQSLPQANFFANAYHGGIFVTKKIGHYEDVIDVDINSAYPFAMSMLNSIVNSRIVDYPSDYTFYKVIAQPQEYLPMKIGNRLYYGKSDKKQIFYLTEWDKKTMDLYGYPYEIIEMIGIETEKKILPLHIADWYAKKNEIKNKYGYGSVEYLNIKIYLNSGYGVFAQSRPHITKYTNFIYASYITAFTRWYILSLIKGYEKDVISISTDGILMKRNEYFLQKYNNRISPEIGALSIEYYDSVTQYANGIYLLEKGDKFKMKKRGYEQLQIEDLFRPVYAIELKQNKPMRMIEAIIQKKYKDINKFTEQIKTFSPYHCWLGTNPAFAEKLKDLMISDFHDIQMDVPIMNLDDHMITQKVADKTINDELKEQKLIEKYTKKTKNKVIEQLSDEGYDEDLSGDEKRKTIWREIKDRMFGW
jgi:hypothetical protein